MAALIEDYALLGDCHGAALVSRDGSIDWLCMPRFDSGACFAALIGDEDNGHWAIRPRGTFAVRRRYLPGTMVLETEFRTATGVCRVIDCLVVEDPHPTLIRRVVGVSGTVALGLELVIRFDYGSIVPWVRTREDGSLMAIAGPDTLMLHTSVPLHGEDLRTRGDFTIAAGQQLDFSLVWHAAYEGHPPPEDAGAALDRTIAWWRAWSARCTYRGVEEALVMRSLLTLKALTYAPSGGIVAAATTSLPEHIGGVRNWDYRYCWVRDATFTLYALLNCGYREEANAWREWLVRAVAGTPSQLNIMYGICGERRLTEVELDWLPGYEGSRPVRIGNAAYRQTQLDVFGEVMDTLHLARRSGLEYSENSWRVQKAMLDYLEGAWARPDEGIWEVRGPQRHFTHSKVMAWVAFDRGIKAIQSFGRPGPVSRWMALRWQVHQEVCTKGYDREIGAFVQSYGSKQADASLLMLALVGFLPASDPRIAGTVGFIERTLLSDGLVMRYIPDVAHDGLPGGEGVFLACSFWLVDNYLLLGRRADAERLFARLIGLCNDVGLLSEEYDVRAGRLLGNFPQALSHIALVNTAANLSRPRAPADDRSHL